ncbi:hypothetical protein L1987_18343 [Smallanthus sonchifolius]|uniref:Uncharacterized protein n=1 Tax=Smallanthus sonchifolius TaxID=185202 RepID=A0ACB9J019_9ASTR|nr:hypothetical protein L1987_18343 [Smallanthus sonchifolius]
MASNGFSFSLAKRDCDLLAREGVHQNLLSFVTPQDLKDRKIRLSWLAWLVAVFQACIIKSFAFSYYYPRVLVELVFSNFESQRDKTYFFSFPPLHSSHSNKNPRKLIPCVPPLVIDLPILKSEELGRMSGGRGCSMLVAHSECAEKTIAKHDKTKLKLNESRKEAEVLMSREKDLMVLKSLSLHKRLLEEVGNGGAGASASVNTKGVGKHKKAKIDAVTPEAPHDVAPIGEGVPALSESLEEVMPDQEDQDATQG